MASTERSADPLARLAGIPERDIVVQAVTDNNLPVAKAVEEIAKLTTIAAAPSAAPDALYLHALYISGSIHDFAMRIPHNQQSRLIDFVVCLQRVTVPDPINGGVITFNDEDFWSDMPEMSLSLADHNATGASYGSAKQQSQHYENCIAYVAQLSEIGFSFYRESIGWNYPQLTRILENDHPTRFSIRHACLWFIYAPNKVWLDVHTEDVDIFFNQGYGRRERFLPDHWPRWKRFWQDWQEKPIEQQLDEDTRELVKQALENMERIEAERS